MQIDKVALYLVIAAFVIYASMILFGLIALGIFSLIAIIPILAVAYLFGTVLSQRVKSREDEYYDGIER